MYIRKNQIRMSKKVERKLRVFVVWKFPVEMRNGTRSLAGQTGTASEKSNKTVALSARISRAAQGYERWPRPQLKHGLQTAVNM